MSSSPLSRDGAPGTLRAYEQGDCGADGYPLAWHETIKHQVREDAGHRCIRCQHPYAKGVGEWSPCDERCTHAGPYRVRRDDPSWTEYPHAGHGAAEAARMVAQGFTVEAAWRILTVHHLDGDKANCRWWNLVALCQRCHLQIQGKVKMERVWPWEHSDWFQPYVAGYYAWTYLREEIARDQAEARLDELLALERMA